MKLFYTYIPNDFTLSITDYLPYLSPHRAEKIRHFRFLKDQLRSLFSELLLSYGLSLPLHELPLGFSYGPNGKPALKNRPNDYFNISHSGNYVICALSNQTIGVDIEEITSVALTELATFFHPKERDALFLDPKTAQTKFFDLWTEKESFLKYKGTGLTTSLDSFYFDAKNGQIIESSTKKRTAVAIKKVPIDPTYSCTVCTQKSEPIVVRSVPISELIARYSP